MMQRNALKIVKSSYIARLYSVAAQPLQQTYEIEYKDAKPYKEIPGPKGYLEIAKLMRPGGRYHNKNLSDVLQLMREDYGSLCIFPTTFGMPPIVMTYLPTDFEKIFRAEGKWPNRRGLDSFIYFRKQYRPDLFKAGGGLTVEQGEAWGDFRTKVNQIMMQPRNAKLYIPGIDEVSMDFVENIRKIRDNKMEMPDNFWEKINMWALESIGLISLNTRLGVLKGSPEALKLNKLIQEMFDLMYQYDILPSIWRWYKTPGFKRAMKVYEEGAEMIISYIKKARDEIKKNPSKSSEHESILEKLLKVDENVAMTMVTDMIGAGIDTTSSAATSVLYCLAKNPDKQEKLREEVFQILPSKESKLNEKSLDSVPYMRAVIKESLRMLPVTGGNLRALKQDIVLQGYQIPKNTDIMMVGSTGMTEFEEADKFIPERWLKENTDPKCPHAKDVHPFSLLSFGFGPRMCIGKRFADLEMEVLTARILREFKITWERPDLKVKSTVLNIPASPLKFKMVDL